MVKYSVNTKAQTEKEKTKTKNNVCFMFQIEKLLSNPKLGISVQAILPSTNGKNIYFIGRTVGDLSF